MKSFDWSAEKNQWLRQERGISFEDIILHLAAGDLLDKMVHPNKERYPGQGIYVVNVSGYAYLVPFVESESEVFLTRIIPSRKATQRYLKGHPS